MRLLPLFLVSLLLHGWIGWRIAPELLSWPPAAALLWGLLGLSALLMPMALLARRASKVSRWLAWGGALAMGLFSTLLVLTLLRDALLLPAWGLSVWLAPDSGGYEALRQGSALAVLAAGLLASAWGLWNARRTAQVVRIDVPIAGLPLPCMASPWRRSPTSMSDPPSARATWSASWRGSTRWVSTWWPSPGTWWMAASPTCKTMWRPWRG
jgi:hypothetical protein